MNDRLDPLSPEILIRAYCEGFFPMAESKDGDIYWHSPDPRAVIPLNNIKFPRSMRQILKKKVFNFTVDADFRKVITACGEREDTWISDDIVKSYMELHRLGYAHSIETWKDGKICGGLYGVSVGGAFFGESMYNAEPNAAKAAFYYLCARLLDRRFPLLDSQYINDFTESLGAIEIPRENYLQILHNAIKLDLKFV